MRTVKTPPANREFFIEHGGRLRVLQFIGFAGQLLSAGSLYYAVYAIIASQLQAAGAGILIAGALVTALLVELANKALAKPAIKPLVVNSMPGNKHHTILNRAYLAGLVVVAALSYYLSAEGSKYLAAAITSPAALVDTDSLETAYFGRMAAAESRYLADTAIVLQSYKVRLKAAETRLQATAGRYANCTRPQCRAAIARAQAQYATETAKVATEQQQAINELRGQLRAELAELRTEHDTRRAEAVQLNTSEKQGHQQQQGHRAALLIVIVIVGQTALYFTTYLVCVIEAGAGITYTLQPNEYWNLPSIINEFSVLLSWRTERAARVALANTLGAKPKERNTAIYYGGLYTSRPDSTSPEHHNGHHHGNGTSHNGSPGHHNGHNGHHNGESTEGHRIASNSTGGAATNAKRYIFVGAGDNCEQCGAEYTRKTTRQRFCNNECRLNYHASKHNGQRYEPGRKF